MSYSQVILNIVEICSQQRVTDLVVSPGSRHAPLALAFSRHKAINTVIISDERSAGYIALGLAQSLKRPVILLCTSGTAALNFGPAIAEAYYQRVPLLVFTADRPPEWIDQNDGQSIRQRNIFQNHVKKSFELPVSLEHPDARWQVHSTINQAFITSTTELPGPVHINAPFREPLYPKDPVPENNSQVPVVKTEKNQPGINQDHWKSLLQEWSKTKKILVAGGQTPFSNKLTAALTHLQRQAKIPVVGDATSNLHRVPEVIKHAEIILGQYDTVLKSLQPDLLITFGVGFISKNLKLFLRRFPPSRHWHVQASGYPPDTFQCLTRVIPMEPEEFIKQLCEQVDANEQSNWLQSWKKQEKHATQRMNKLLHSQELNEMVAVDQVIRSAGGIYVHLANSSPVRWVDLIGVAPEIKEIYSNRGTSGIDGCTSTAVGHSLVSKNRQQLLITGDMAFFYDRNAFWHQYKLPNLKIVILNNHGGGIFRLIDGARNQPELEELFVTQQVLRAENTARDFGMKYLFCNRKEDLAAKLGELLAPNDHASVLEIEFSNNIAEIYLELKASLKNSHVEN